MCRIYSTVQAQAREFFLVNFFFSQILSQIPILCVCVCACVAAANYREIHVFNQEFSFRRLTCVIKSWRVDLFLKKSLKYSNWVLLSSVAKCAIFC